MAKINYEYMHPHLSLRRRRSVRLSSRRSPTAAFQGVDNTHPTFAWNGRCRPAVAGLGSFFALLLPPSHEAMEDRRNDKQE